MPDYASRPGFDDEDGHCLLCSTGTARTVTKRGSTFLGCSNYPSCRNTALISHPRWPSGSSPLGYDDILTIEYEVYRQGRDWG